MKIYPKNYPHRHHFVRLQVSDERAVTLHLRKRYCYCGNDKDDETFRGECICRECVKVFMDWMRDNDLKL